MSVDDEAYYESHEFELYDLYYDYLTEYGLAKDEFTLADFRNTL